MCALLLTGCAQEPAKSPPSAIAIPEPSASPSTDTVSTPHSRLGIECADLITDAVVAERIPGAIFRTDYFADMISQSATVPEGLPVLQRGGLVCQWSAVTSVGSFVGSPQGYTGLKVVVQPDAAADWQRFLDNNDRPESGEWYCFNYREPAGTFCHLEALVNGSWVSIEIVGIDPESTDNDVQLADRVRPFVDGILSIVESADVTGPAWSNPLAEPLPSTCEALLPMTQVAAITARTGLVAYDQARAPYPSESDGPPRVCDWGYGYESSFGSMTVVPGGAWALEQTLPAVSPSGAAAAIEITGADEDDRAWVRCTIPGQMCVLDLAIGRNWIQLALFGFDSDGNAVSADPAATITRLAEGVTANLKT